MTKRGKRERIGRIRKNTESDSDEEITTTKKPKHDRRRRYWPEIFAGREERQIWDDKNSLFFLSPGWNMSRGIRRINISFVVKLVAMRISSWGGGIFPKSQESKYVRLLWPRQGVVGFILEIIKRQNKMAGIYFDSQEKY